MKVIKIFYVLLIGSILLVACAPSVNQPTADSPPAVLPTDSLEPEPDEAQSPEEVAEPTVIEPEVVVNAPPGAERQFTTDFSIHSVPYDEILAGGPPKDGIPSIDQPNFIDVEEADEWIGPLEPIIQVSINQEIKGYPIQILTWHEIVNDTVGGVPVVVTFCPLCNTAIAFERTVEGQVLDFGTTGRLRYSNLIMYDRQTESWWQQGTGEGIVGTLTGTQLDFVPAGMVSWETFKNANPDGMVLSRDTGHSRSYGRNPYIGYDDVNNSPFLYQGPATPGELPPVARVLTLEFDGETVAYPYDILSDVQVVNDRVGEQDVVVFWAPGTASALDSGIIAEGEDVGTALAYDRNLEGQELSFRFEDGSFVDNETESSWDLLGQAVDGPLSGQQLTEVVSLNYFWFSWASFKPETRVYHPDL